MTYLPYRYGLNERKLVCVECLKTLNVGERYSRIKGTPMHLARMPESSAKSLSRLFDAHGQRHGQALHNTE